MVNCPNCGTKNDEDALFCTHCGTSLRSDIGSTIEHHAKQFADNMEAAGKKVGERMSQAAKKIQDDTQVRARHLERRMDRMNRNAENWYDSTFKFFGPLLSSFVFLIIFRLVLAVMEIPSAQTPDLNIIAGILLPYLLPLFAVSLLSNYTKYLSRKYYSVRIFSPLLYAVVVALLFWILSRILYDVSVQYIISDLRASAASLESSLPSIFVFVLLLGYVILFINMPREVEKKP